MRLGGGGLWRVRCIAPAMVLAAVLSAAPAGAQTTICQNRPITTFDFRNPTLESGAPLAVGAVYRFSNVAIGADALVTIDALTNGTLSVIDRDAGLIENFQPELNNVNAASADFTVRFVASGGTTPLVFDFAASGIDIDGNNANLREYAEFSTPFAEYVLDNPTQLDVDASGPSAGDRIRFESRTSLVAPGIDPTATGNIVSTFYSAASEFQYRIGTLGSGSMTRLNSLDFSCPNLNFPASQPQIDQDFGDAPTALYGDPRHDIDAGVRIGATNTIETAPYDSPSASGDLGDDGVTMPALARGQLATISVAVVGSGGRLQAWIDWDDDGDFADPADQIAADVSDGGVGDNDGAANGVIQLAVAPPASAAVGLSFARFRWSTRAGVGPDTVAPDGEVEDYIATVSASAPPSCPSGRSVASGSGFADAVIQPAVNSSAALGALAAPGAATSNANSARINNANRTLVLDLTDLVPESSPIEISVARNNANGAVDIDYSPDNAVWTNAGSFSGGVVDVLQRVVLNGSAGGVRYVRFQRTSGSVHIDGISYSQICLGGASLTSAKSVALFDPTNAPYAVPGSDVLYTITTINAGDGPADADSIFIVDDLPAEVEFFNGDIDGAGPETGPVAFAQSGGANLVFDAAVDLAFSNGVAPPASFAACGYTPASGYDPDIAFVCFRPRGAMNDGDPDPSFSLTFRVRIK